MTEIPLVSIIAICHKHAPYVLETLESIRKQTYSNIELIIINNIKDECEGIIQTWIKEHEVACKFIQNEVPLSITKNLNLGLEQTNGKYFQGVSCDDVLMPSKIESQVSLFESLSNEYACIYGDVLKIDKNGKIISKESEFTRLRRILKVEKLPKGSLVNELSERPFIHAPSVLLRTKHIRSTGGYDESLAFEDWPMWLLLSNLGYHFHPSTGIVAHYRILENSLDRTRGVDFYRTHIEIFKRFSKHIDLTATGLRNHWMTALIRVKKEGRLLEFIRESINYLLIVKDFRLRTFYKLLTRQH